MSTHESDERQHAVFKIGDQRYAIGIESVQEIIRVPKVTALPGTSGGLVGLINLRGNILPLFDAGRCLQLSTSIINQAKHVIILASEKGMVGLLVDEVIEVCSLDEVAEPEKLLPSADQFDGSVEGISIYGDGLVIRLNADQLLTAKAVHYFQSHPEHPVNTPNMIVEGAGAGPKLE